MKRNSSCLVAAAVAALLPFAASASSHREAPNIARFPTVDSTDFYLFNSYQANRAGYDYVYLGYWVKDSPKMDYKARYQPLEGLTDFGWQEISPFSDS